MDHALFSMYLVSWSAWSCPILAVALGLAFALALALALTRVAFRTRRNTRIFRCFVVRSLRLHQSNLSRDRSGCLIDGHPVSFVLRRDDQVPCVIYVDVSAGASLAQRTIEKP